MEDPTGIDERSWFLAPDVKDILYLCFEDGEKLLLHGYEHEEERTDCVQVMLSLFKLKLKTPL